MRANITLEAWMPVVATNMKDAIVMSSSIVTLRYFFIRHAFLYPSQSEIVRLQIGGTFIGNSCTSATSSAKVTGSVGRWDT
jgi:hypothetical protein